MVAVVLTAKLVAKETAITVIAIAVGESVVLVAGPVEFAVAFVVTFAAGSVVEFAAELTEWPELAVASVVVPVVPSVVALVELTQMPVEPVTGLPSVGPGVDHTENRTCVAAASLVL